MAVPVYVTGAPHSGHLMGWGQDPEGRWWGLLTWWQRLVDDRKVLEQLHCAAWVPASRLTRPPWSSATSCARLRLDPDPGCWPAPPQWTGWYAGRWDAGSVPCPAGRTPAAGPAWRRRHT